MHSITDKRGILNDPNLLKTNGLSLELGCGPRKRHANSIGIDALDYPCVDLVGDVFEILRKLPDSSVISVYASHFIEHVENVDLLLTELARVLKVDGQLELVAPHFSNPYFYSDPTHRRFFGLYTFSYLANDTHLSRRVPTYQKILHFKLESVRLGFKSTRPFYFRHAIKRIVGAFFDSCIFLRELYEENFCYLFPCYEVHYKLIRISEKGHVLDL